MDPQSPDILYAAAYERRRTPFGFNGGGRAAAYTKRRMAARRGRN